jgi:small subunit ribosomal protein S20
MANLASSKKQARKSIRQSATNKSRKSAVKSAVKKVIEALQAKDIKAARSLLKDAEARLARAASKGLIHRNNASRNISRLALRVANAE